MLKDSNYAKSKLEGEKNIFNNFLFQQFLDLQLFTL